MIDASLYFPLAKNLLPLSRYRCARTLGSRVQADRASNSTGRNVKDFERTIPHSSPQSPVACKQTIVLGVSALTGYFAPYLEEITRVSHRRSWSDRFSVSKPAMMKPIKSVN